MNCYTQLLDPKADHPSGAVIPLRVAAARLRLAAAARIDAAEAELAAARADYDESSRMFCEAQGIAALPDHTAHACVRFYGEPRLTEGKTLLAEVREVLGRQVGGRAGYPAEGLLAAAEASRPADGQPVPVTTKE